MKTICEHKSHIEQKKKARSKQSVRITVQQTTLITALSHAARGVEARTTMPILSGLLWEVETHAMRFTATNDDYTIVHRLPIDGETIRVTASGRVVLPAKLTTDLVRRLPQVPLEVTVDAQNVVHFSAGALEYTVHGMEAEDFPRLPTLPLTTMWHVSGRRLAALFRHVLFAVAVDQTRPILKGVELVAEERRLVATATDSHRLAQSELELVGEATDGKLVVPGKSVQEVIGLFEAREEPVELALGDKVLVMQDDRFTVYFRLLSGAYPDTRMLIPREAKTSVTFERLRLIDALERAFVIAQHNRNQTVRLTVGETVELFTVHPELGKYNETIAVRARQGDDLVIWFNARYLLDALKYIDAEAVAIGANGALSPFVVRPEGATVPTHLIVPVKTG
ncbi:MAG: DNA polymerase III subunit beta [Hydrogenibacillus sp.]|nr:DNA polymerase III subunit beta [Hydrogenibacillus sp.]